MTADEEFVRANWERVATGAAALDLSDYSAPIVISGNECASWSAAAEFTRDRLEQIRQVEEEIEQMRDMMHFKDQDIDSEIENLGDPGPWTLGMSDDGLIAYVRDQCRYYRTLSRLEAIRDDLKRGMRK